MMLPVNIASGMLPPDALADLGPELTHAYYSRQIFRTETEARISVLSDLYHPTKASKYWQAVREQTVMLEQLALASFDYRRNELSIKRHSKALTEAADEFAVEEAQINLDECVFRREGLRTTAEDRVRELRMWSMLKAEVDDGSFDTSDPNTHQLISYTTEFALTADATKDANMSTGEMANLCGKLQTAIARCKELGVLDQVFANLPAKTIEKLGR